MNYKHGHKRKKKVSSEYRAWCAMGSRCNNSNDSAYHNYGGRGIYVEDYFRGPDGFQHFLDYMGKCPKGKSLDRYPDNDSGYIRGNMRWATREEQAANTRKLNWFIGYHLDNKFMEKSNNQSEFARQHKIDSRNISACLNGKQKTVKGWRFQWM